MAEPFDEVDDIRPFLAAGAFELDTWTPDDTVHDTRDYLLTGGRTVGGTEIRIETLVSLTDVGRSRLRGLSPEQLDIVRISASGTHSISEIASATRMSLGVTRVLAGDLVADGILHQSDSSRKTIRNAAFIERLITGVKSL